MILLLACGGAAAPVPAPDPVSPEPVVVPFSCATAATALGHPGATVTLCLEMPVLRGVFRVGLEGGDLPGPTTRIVAVREGQPIAERGGKAAAAFLRDARAWELDDLVLDEVRDLLSALEAWPSGFSATTTGVSLPGQRTNEVTVRPFVLTVTSAREDYERGGRSGGAKHQYYVRATLSGGDAEPFGWVMELGDGKGPWSEIAREAWE